MDTELLKIKPAVVLQEPEAGKKRSRSKPQPAVAGGEDIVASIPPQVQQLRAALKGGNISVDTSTGHVRH
ncbi:MAG: hypothetical protein WCP96_13640 [Methylococcaceae bacterium]